MLRIYVFVNIFHIPMTNETISVMCHKKKVAIVMSMYGR